MAEYTAATVQQLTERVLQSSLEEIIRSGARKMLQAALELEVDEYIQYITRSGQAMLVRWE